MINPNECSHERTVLEEDVGFDIQDGGEERQHLETCEICGSERFVSDVLNWETNQWSRRKGRWRKPWIHGGLQ